MVVPIGLAIGLPAATPARRRAGSLVWPFYQSICPLYQLPRAWQSGSRIHRLPTPFQPTIYPLQPQIQPQLYSHQAQPSAVDAGDLRLPGEGRVDDVGVVDGEGARADDTAVHVGPREGLDLVGLKARVGCWVRLDLVGLKARVGCWG